ncbi:3-hydroxyacyl-CoA dehydrogenase NAD-binding domain-containing protein [Caballeronia sp. dw_19]|uniref:3-hydroxyacyl-CoA dehydrogenase NAD-binding domain-containing protein n=1 Tax=Caballeronia sp. dw_19 TaxID=2719791 RepID=UPI001BD532B7|nr:3-hydroxyacyl-CoA dehydrogenase NAD-binding domain-containing protein [Caballeronia sp. dw_19]
MTSSLDIRRGIAVILLDSPPVNALGFALRSELYERIGAGLDNPDVRGIVLAGSGARAFSAGADIAEFGTAPSTAFPSLNDLIARIEQARVPVVAAIDGFALGGGMELALGCHARVASARASLGLPEITLGLMPGAGGTQRLPRLVGRMVAREFIVAGRPLRADAAQRMGIVDAIVEGDLIEGAVKLLSGWIESGAPLPRTCDRPLPVDRDAGASRKAARENAYALPVETINRCIDAAGAMPFDEGMQIERTLFEELVARPESEALRYAFFAEKRAASLDERAAQDVAARTVDEVAIVGAGTMGAGIATCFANSGVAVRLFDAKPESLEKGIASIRLHYAQQAQKGRLSAAEAERRAGLVTPVSQVDSLAEAGLVIEAVFEDLDVKRQVFTHLDAVMRPGAILATNTSTLDVNAIAQFTERPRDVVGLHFFSPAPVMRLLEIVRGTVTAPDVLVSALALAKRLGKVGVVSGVCDGFIGNRMWHEYLRQAARIVELGAAPQQVDSALEQWGFAMGPFHVADLAGLDVGYLIRQRQMHERPQLRWPAWLDRVSESGRLGLKGGSGIYRYEAGQRGGMPDREVNELISQARAEAGVAPRTFTDDEIIQRCTHALIVEGTRLLQEGIAQRGSDVDAVFLNGYGFPRHRGGPLFNADALGLHAVVANLHVYANHEEPAFWQPPALLLELAARGHKLSAFSRAGVSAGEISKETV